MIIGVKYWNEGGSVPANWTDLHVAECEAVDEIYEYDSGEGIDGTEFGYKRTRYTVRLVVDPWSFNHGTYGSVVAGLRAAHLCRIKDVRYSFLGDANTINFRVGGSTPTRTEPSLLTRQVEITLRAVAVV